MTLGHNGRVSYEEDEDHMVLKANQDGNLGTIDHTTASRRTSVSMQLHDHLEMYSYTSTQASIREWPGVHGEVKDVRWPLSRAA